jgi:hypothetical protein
MNTNRKMTDSQTGDQSGQVEELRALLAELGLEPHWLGSR